MDVIFTKEKFIHALRVYVDEQYSSDNFSGSVLVALDGNPILEFSSGLANREMNIPNGIDTKFNLGSANKMFTGVAIAQLAEAGSLGFQDAVGTYLPDYPNQVVREQITIHQLLTHTSGLGSFIDLDYRDEFLAARENLKSIDDVVNLFVKYPVFQEHCLRILV